MAIAKGLVAWVPFAFWRASLGEVVERPAAMAGTPGPRLRSVVAAVRRAVARAPFPVKCLPQAMALQWMLRRRGLGSVLTVGTLPKAGRGTLDDLHAWVTVAGRICLGQSERGYVPVLHLSSCR